MGDEFDQIVSGSAEVGGALAADGGTDPSGAPTGTSDGHVGFYLRETADAVCVLGGNQSDRVSEAWIAKTRLLAMRWPLSVPLPEGGAVWTDRRIRLSTNEL